MLSIDCETQYYNQISNPENIVFYISLHIELLHTRSQVYDSIIDCET